MYIMRAQETRSKRVIRSLDERVKRVLLKIETNRNTEHGVIVQDIKQRATGVR